MRISEEITRLEERVEEGKLRKERDTVLLEQAQAQLSALEKELAEQSQPRFHEACLVIAEWTCPFKFRRCHKSKEI